MKKIMSKRVVSLLLALLFIVPLMFLATACSESVATVSTYNELVDALNGNKQIVKLEEDIDVESVLVIGRKVTLDMNGKTLSNSNDLWDKEPNSWSIISVRENGDLTIKGNGKIQAKENDCYAIDVMDGGNLAIEDGKFIGNISAVYAYEGNVKISGGTYSIQQLNDNKVEGPYGQTINIYNQNADKTTVEITGGVFKNFNPSDKTDNKDKLVADGYEAVLIEGTTDYKVVKKA